MISWGQNSISGKGLGGRYVPCALKNQRDDLLGFAQVLDEKLDGISAPEDPLYLVRQMSVFPQTADLQRWQLGTSYTRNCLDSSITSMKWFRRQ